MGRGEIEKLSQLRKGNKEYKKRGTVTDEWKRSWWERAEETKGKYKQKEKGK